MNNFVQFEISSEDDEAILDQLTNFFEPFATVHIKKREPIAAKSLNNVINLAVSIIAEWAATQFILNPMYNRAVEWRNSITSTWKSSYKRPFNIVVKLGPTTDNLFEVQMSSTIDEDALSKLWTYIEKAHCICEQSRKQSIFLNKIRIVPDGTQKILVIGYENNRPKYIVNLENKTLQPINATPSSETEQEISEQIWSIQILVRELDYLKMLREHGTNIQQNEIQELERQIAIKKNKLVTH